MLDDFNLLVSTSRGNERNACSEMWYLLKEIGDPHAKTDVTGILGLITARTSLELGTVIPQLRRLLIEKPWEFRYILKLVPIQTIVESNLERLGEKGKRLNDQIPQKATFRITVGKRRSELRSKDIIEAIAPHIQRKVDLKNPDRIIVVEVIGDVSGLSLVRPDEMLSVEREKRNL